MRPSGAARSCHRCSSRRDEDFGQDGDMTDTVREAGLAFTDAKAYTDNERLHDGLALLRRESPVHWVDAPGYRPFWALTRHADVMAVERDHHRFRNGPRPILSSTAVEERIAELAAVG